MAFPTTGILDNFNRADAADLGANWSLIRWSHLSIESNQSSSPEFLVAEDYWNVESFGPDSEVYATVTWGSSDDALVGFYLRMMDPPSLDGYHILCGGSSYGIYYFSRFDNGVETILGAYENQNFASGDSVGASMVGDTLTSYHKPAAGSWSALATRTDATYSGAGYLGLYQAAVDGDYVDDFGGGTIVVPPNLDTRSKRASAIYVGSPWRDAPVLPD